MDVAVCDTILYQRPAGQPETPSFPGPDQTDTGRGGVGWGGVGSGRVGSGDFISGRPGWGILFRVGPGQGILLPEYETFSPGILGINLPFIPKLRK